MKLKQRDADFLFASINNLYFKKQIPKKDGSVRQLFIPNKDLKAFQKSIIKFLEKQIKFPFYVQGGIKRRSIITNAKMHCNKNWVSTFDIKDFFPNVNLTKIDRAISNSFDFSSDLSNFIKRLVTFKNCIPQGAPSSPFFANLSCWRMDKRIQALCQKESLIYSRYFDDITISGDDNVVKIFNNNSIDKIVKSEGFKINSQKKKIYSNKTDQIVTGIIVNNGLKLENKLIEVIRKDILNGEYLDEKNKNKLKGKISFVKSVDKELGKKLECLLISKIKS